MLGLLRSLAQSQVLEMVWSSEPWYSDNKKTHLQQLLPGCQLLASKPHTGRQCHTQYLGKPPFEGTGLDRSSSFAQHEGYSTNSSCLSAQNLCRPCSSHRPQAQNPGSSVGHCPGASTGNREVVWMLQCQLLVSILHNGCDSLRTQFPCSWARQGIQCGILPVKIHLRPPGNNRESCRLDPLPYKHGRHRHPQLQSCCSCLLSSRP